MNKKSLYLFTALLIGNLVHAQVSPVRWADIQKRFTHGKDTLYVVNLWATWCAPCIQELPYFDGLPEKIGNRPIKVILISMDFLSQLQSAVIPFAQKQKLKSEVRIIQEPDQQAFIDDVDKNWSGAIPATLFFDSKNAKRDFQEKDFSKEKLEQTIYNILK